MALGLKPNGQSEPGVVLCNDDEIHEFSYPPRQWFMMGVFTTVRPKCWSSSFVARYVPAHIRLRLLCKLEREVLAIRS